ncbi:unannotated protein [freshwater metagenome]|uniref:Unannotated protein n=1 Tax=freshwater metagenome TaxID=449393 RepID=A0A6J6JET6_9ZZZZ
MDPLCTTFRRPFLGVIKKVATATSALNTWANSDKTNRRDQIAIDIAIDTNGDH